MILQPAGLDAMEVDALQTDRYLDALLSAIERRADDVPADPAIDPTLRLAARRLRDELVRVHPSFRFEERLARRLADAAARMRLATAAGSEAEAAIIPFPATLFADPALAAELVNPELAALLGAGYAAALPGDAGQSASGISAAAGQAASGSPGSVRTPASGRDGAADARHSAAASAGSALGATPADLDPAPLRPVGARPLLVGGALTSAALSLAGAAFVAWRLTRGASADPMARAVRANRAAREESAPTALHAFAIATALDAARRRRGLS